jgi:hypothetical protein
VELWSKYIKTQPSPNKGGLVVANDHLWWNVFCILIEERAIEAHLWRPLSAMEQTLHAFNKNLHPCTPFFFHSFLSHRRFNILHCFKVTTYNVKIYSGLVL